MYNLNNGEYRSDSIIHCLNDSIQSHNIIAFNGETSDRFVYCDILTNLEHLLEKHMRQTFGMQTWRYTLNEGAINFTPANSGIPSTPPPDVQDAQAVYLAFRELIDAMSASNEPKLLMIDYAEDLFNDIIWIEQVCAMALDPEFHNEGHLVVLIDRKGDMPQTLAKIPGVTNARIPLPEYDERLEAIRLMMGSQVHSLCLANDLSREVAANISGSLSLDDLHRLRLNTCPENPLSFDQLLEAKKATILQRAGELIEVYEVVDLKTGVAGLSGPNLFLQDQLSLGINTFGVLFDGSPGTGKTLVSKAMAYSMGLPCIAFKSIKAPLYGQAEQNMRAALDIVLALAPCVVLFDEIERFFHKRGGNSDNSSASHSDADIEGMLLGFVNDTLRKKNGIVIIGTVNNPQWLDTAALDRFEIIPVLPETAPMNKAKIAAIEAKSYGVEFDVDGAAKAFSESPDDYSGRDVSRMIKPARRHASETEHPNRIEYGDMQYAISSANCSIDDKDIYQCMLALQHTSDQRYFPWNAALISGAGQAEIPGWFRPYVDDKGYMNKEQRQLLKKRLAEMEVEYDR